MRENVASLHIRYGEVSKTVKREINQFPVNFSWHRKTCIHESIQVRRVVYQTEKGQVKNKSVACEKICGYKNAIINMPQHSLFYIIFVHEQNFNLLSGSRCSTAVASYENVMRMCGRLVSLSNDDAFVIQSQRIVKSRVQVTLDFILNMLALLCAGRVQEVKKGAHAHDHGSHMSSFWLNISVENNAFLLFLDFFLNIASLSLLISFSASPSLLKDFFLMIF